MTAHIFFIDLAEQWGVEQSPWSAGFGLPVFGAHCLGEREKYHGQKGNATCTDTLMARKVTQQVQTL